MTPKRILIMDDSALVLDLAQAALEQAGFQVSVAVDLAAFEQARDASLEAGADLFLHKPLVLRDLFATLEWLTAGGGVR